MRQTLVTCVAKIQDGKVDELREFLVQNPQPLPFDAIPVLHFSSMFLTNGPGPVYFVWESNFDGTLDDYLRSIVFLADAHLRALYQHCEGYDPKSDLYGYLDERTVKPAVYHIGAPGRSVSRIHEESSLEKSLQRFLDVADTAAFRSPAAVQDYLQRAVRATPDLRWAETPDLRWAETPEIRLTFPDMLWRWISFGFLILVGILALPLAPLIAAWIRLSDLGDQPIDIPQGPELNEMLRYEDRGIQNHFANITTLKPGFFRTILVRLVMWSSRIFTRIQVHGKLGNIPGIFFAHWSIIDEGSKLLFVTNYSLGWESYLDDFIDLAGTQLTVIWANTVGFPRSRMLFGGGAAVRTAFKNFARKHQVPSLVWYSAYPEVTIQNVNRNSDIRDGLFRKMHTAQLKKWLQLF